jgi:transketolase
VEAFASSLFKAKRISCQARINILNTVYRAKGGHLGGSLSVVDILSAIYTFGGDLDFELILSKGHCLLGWLCVLHEIGEISSDDLTEYYSNGAKFAGHPKRCSSPSITWGTGSLGHGLSVTCGKALGNKNKIFICVLGDGECNEGSVWEAFMFMAQHSINNIVVVIDNNKQESLDKTCNIMSIEDIEKRLSGFNLIAKRVNGHDLCALGKELNTAFAPQKEAKPLVLVADTIKGKGVSFMEGIAKWHHRKLTADELSEALSEVQMGALFQ